MRGHGQDTEHLLLKAGSEIRQGQNEENHPCGAIAHRGSGSQGPLVPAQEKGGIMLTIYRRHRKNCGHRGDGRAYRRCSCPIWTDGIFDGAEIRQSLKVGTWDEAERELERLKS